MDHEWCNNVQRIIEKIDACIANKNDESLTLCILAQEFGYSQSHFSRKFKEISGMQFRDYLRYRKLAFALKQLRDTPAPILEIALDYGFSSHEAFTRAFKEAYGMTPSEYRRDPVPVALRTIIKPFDCYLLENGGTGMEKTAGEIKTYFVTIPAHKFLHIRNYESIIEAGLDHIRFTDLRHTCAIASLRNGMEAKELAQMLGHARTSMTRQNYTPYLPHKKKKDGESPSEASQAELKQAANILDNLLKF